MIRIVTFSFQLKNRNIDLSIFHNDTYEYVSQQCKGLIFIFVWRSNQFDKQSENT